MKETDFYEESIRVVLEFREALISKVHTLEKGSKERDSLIYAIGDLWTCAERLGTIVSIYQTKKRESK